MAGKSQVVVAFLGDTTGLDKAMGRAQTNLGRMGGVFQTIGGQIGGEFGAAMDAVGGGLEKVGDKAGKHIGVKLATAGTVVGGLGIALQNLGSENQQAQDQLRQAIENTGSSFDTYGGQIDATIGKMQDFGHSDDDTQTALRTLTQATNDPAKALKEMGLVADLAAAKHISLSDSALLVAKVLTGKGQRALTEFGITMKKGKDGTADTKGALDELAKKVDGQASTSVDNFKSKVDIVKTKMGDWAADMANKVGPAMTTLGPVAMGAGAIIESGAAKAAAGWIKGGAKAALSWAGSAAGMIGSGIAAGASWIGEQIAMAASSIASAAAAAAGWIAANAAMILATGGIMLAIGAIILGALWLKNHWSEVWAKIKEWAAAAWGWIKQNWGTVLAIITGPIGLAIKWIHDNWDKISGFFGTVIDKIKPVVGKVFDIITWPFKTAFNAVADLWNGTLGKMSFTVPSWIPVIGGKGFSFPQMPHLADGGIVSKPTIALIGEAGPEAVVPLSRGRGGMGHGGGTVINLNIGAGVIHGTPLEVARQLKTVMQYGQLNGMDFGVPA